MTTDEAGAEMRVPVRRLPHGGDLPLPQKASPGAAGADLHAAVTETVVLEPGDRIAVPTGLVMALPRGWEAQVRPRSGLALRHGVTVLNSPGTIDADYRGEIQVLLVHHGNEPLEIRRGDRIAQLVLARVADATFEEVDSLAETERGDGGFGSSGR